MSKFEEVKGDLQQTVDRLPLGKLNEVQMELEKAAHLLAKATQGTTTKVGAEFQTSLKEIHDIFYKLEMAEAVIGQLAVKMGGAISPQTATITQYSFNADVDPKIHSDAITQIEREGYPDPTLLAEKSHRKTPEEEAAIKAVNDTANAYLEERLGVTLEDRTPPMSRFHIVDKQAIEELRSAAVGSDSETSGDAVAFAMGKDVIIPRGIHPSIVQHESLHPRMHYQSSVTNVKNEDNGDMSFHLSIDRRGIVNDETGDFRLFSEAIIEKTNQEIIKQKWSNNPQLQDIQPTDAAYGNLLPYFDMVCDIVAQKTGNTADEILKGFQRAEFLGDMRIFDTLHDTLSPKIIEQLATLQLQGKENTNE